MLGLCFAVSCEKETHDPADGPEPIWRQSFNRAELTGSMTPVVTAHGVIFSNFSTTTVKEPLISYDLARGNKQWVWDDYPGGQGVVVSSGNRSPILVDDRLIISTGGGNFALDVRNGQTLWGSAYKNVVRLTRFGHSVLGVEVDGTATSTRNTIYLYDMATPEAGTV